MQLWLYYLENQMLSTILRMVHSKARDAELVLEPNQWLLTAARRPSLGAVITLHMEDTASSSSLALGTQYVAAVSFSFCHNRLQQSLLQEMGLDEKSEADDLQFEPGSFELTATTEDSLAKMLYAARNVLDEVLWHPESISDEELAASLPQSGIKPDQLAGAFNPDDDDAPLSDELISQLKDNDSELDIAATEAPRVVRERIGQQRYRKRLEELWEHQCAVTLVRDPILLRASHAMPWAECKSGADRLSPYNGFLLNVALDALFDKFLISFDEQGTIMLASSLKLEELKDIGITKELKLRKLLPQHERFLSYHRERFLAKQNEAQDTAKTGAGDTAME